MVLHGQEELSGGPVAKRPLPGPATAGTLWGMAGIFATLPESFFSPLASPNKVDYAACLLIFYRLFQESPGGVERSALLARLAEYVVETGHELTEELEETGLGLVFDPESSADADMEEAEDVEPAETRGDPARATAAHILRRLTAYGWLGEDILPDYTRMITLAAHAKPFFDALLTVENGTTLEYESHVVAIYSSLCGDAVKEHGHHAVLNAHYHLSLLVDSLKVLSQNIRTHYDKLLDTGADSAVAEILRLHYDRYLEDVIDRAYARLKTSDNLSKYRPRIVKTVLSLLTDKTWVTKTAAALSLLRRETAEEARRRLIAMLEDIRDQLRALDPTLDEIDRRNMLYARSSLEQIRSRLRSDATVAGRLTEIIKAVARDGTLVRRLSHHIHHAHWLGKESRYNRWFRESAVPVLLPKPQADRLQMEKAEAELRLRIARQLTPERVAAWLDGQLGTSGFAWAHDLAVDQESFVRVLHATAYGEAHRLRFPFTVEWTAEEATASGWTFRQHGYRRIR